MYHRKKIFNMVRDHVHMVSVVQGGGEVIVFLALLGAPLFDHSTGKPPKRRALHELWFLLCPTFSIHLHILRTSQQIKALQFYRYWTYLQFSTHTQAHAHAHTHTHARTHIHTASQNIDGFVKGDHVVTILFVLNIFRNEHTFQILVAGYFI